METYFDSRLDLLQRNLAKQSDRLKMKADMAIQGIRKDIFKQMKSPSGEPIADNLEKELQKFKLKASPLSCRVVAHLRVRERFRVYRREAGKVS